jgi:hypothetical protein
MNGVREALTGKWWSAAGFCVFQRFEWVSMLCKASREEDACCRKDDESSPKGSESADWVDMPLYCKIESTTMSAMELFVNVKDVRPHWFESVNEICVAADWEARPRWISERWVHPFAARGHHPARRSWLGRSTPSRRREIHSHVEMTLSIPCGIRSAPRICHHASAEWRRGRHRREKPQWPIGAGAAEKILLPNGRWPSRSAGSWTRWT